MPDRFRWTGVNRTGSAPELQTYIWYCETDIRLHMHAPGHRKPWNVVLERENVLKVFGMLQAEMFVMIAYIAEASTMGVCSVSASQWERRDGSRRQAHGCSVKGRGHFSYSQQKVRATFSSYMLRKRVDWFGNRIDWRSFRWPLFCPTLPCLM